MATWRVWGNSLSTADLTGGTDVYQPVTFTENNQIMLACRSWFIFYSSPVFTNLKMRVYSNDGGAPGEVIATSTNSWNAADLYTQAHAVKEMYFDFDYPTFKIDDLYHFVPYADTYTGTINSHIAWKNTFPDPPYKAGLTLTYEKLLIYPYDLTIIGSALK